MWDRGEPCVRLGAAVCGSGVPCVGLCGHLCGAGGGVVFVWGWRSTLVVGGDGGGSTGGPCVGPGDALCGAGVPCVGVCVGLGRGLSVSFWGWRNTLGLCGAGGYWGSPAWGWGGACVGLGGGGAGGPCVAVCVGLEKYARSVWGWGGRRQWGTLRGRLCGAGGVCVGVFLRGRHTLGLREAGGLLGDPAWGWGALPGRLCGAGEIP